MDRDVRNEGPEDGSDEAYRKRSKHPALQDNKDI